jgi:DNA-binding transcriptional MerR regulator
MATLYRITEAAELVGCSASTIRRLESAGAFIAQRDRSGVRRYDDADVATLRAILFPTRSADKSDAGLDANDASSDPQAALASLAERAIAAAATPETFSRFVEELTTTQLAVVRALKGCVPQSTRARARWMLGKLMEGGRLWLIEELCLPVENPPGVSLAQHLSERYAETCKEGCDRALGEAMIEIEAKVAERDAIAALAAERAADNRKRARQFDAMVAGHTSSSAPAAPATRSEPASSRHS